MSRILDFWRLHSRSIMCTTGGSILMAVGWWLAPSGGNLWDLLSGVGAVLLAFGLEGVVNYIGREVNKPED